MTDLSYSNGQLAKNWLRWHGLGFLPPTRRSTACTFNVCDRCTITWCSCGCHGRLFRP